MAAGKRRCRWEIGFFIRALVLVLSLSASQLIAAPSSSEPSRTEFPRPLDSYAPQPATASVFEILKARVEEEPFNLVATLIFFAAIAHTFAAPTFLRLSHRFEREHQERLPRSGRKPQPSSREEVSFKAQIFHFLGEVEAIFGIWVIPLLIA